MKAEAEGSFLQTGKPWVRERRKRKHQGVVCVRVHVCIWRQCNKDPSASLGMTVLGERIDSQGRLRRLFLLGRCPEVAFKSPVTSHSYDTRERIVSHVWHEILRLSPHLFWLGFFTHRVFSSAQDDDTRRRKGSHLGDTLRVLELAV